MEFFGKSGTFIVCADRIIPPKVVYCEHNLYFVDDWRRAVEMQLDLLDKQIAEVNAEK